ncbi:hypothetical protein MA16_Dca000751 [Dendrobium catenatum]|uniref:Uncharacterized protein n=1 Tax=Dendrobium catenatum TaxID=906689 RepID=A0A2I0WUR9_9ASPA|nr:hypothetical protein MA16_Dca000751 [Dendrobium catenatum]
MREKRCEGDHTVAPNLLYLAPLVALEEFEGGSPRERLVYISDLELKKNLKFIKKQLKMKMEAQGEKVELKIVVQNMAAIEELESNAEVNQLEEGKTCME